MGMTERVCFMKTIHVYYGHPDLLRLEHSVWFSNPHSYSIYKYIHINSIYHIDVIYIIYIYLWICIIYIFDIYIIYLNINIKIQI